MKPSHIFPMIVILSLFSCGRKQETTVSAEKQNEAMADANNDSKSKDDYDFAAEAAEGNLLEIRLGELAQQKSSNGDIRRMAEQIVADHTKANNELKVLTHQKNVVLPNSLNEKNQKIYDHFSKIDSGKFDRKYAKLMIDDHKEDIAAFKKESTTGNDPDLKSWAAENIPTLERHLMLAEKVGNRE